ncbi:ABC transporter permease [Oxalobacteraceae bacterium]|nr:ABC transporter permease [Oxalobacteraceae bacterium]
MIAHPSVPALLRRLHRATLAWMGSWWRLLHFAVVMFSLALDPNSYRNANRHALAHHIVRGSAPNLLWFTVLASLISLVLIRIVVVTSQSYGLSRFALEMVVRVLVLELIPLTAAMFVAMRSTLPAGLAFAHQWSNHLRGDQVPAQLLRREFFPRVASGMFAVWLLAAVSCVLTLVLAYLVMYGFTPWALDGYTRVVGQVFNPAVALILLLKVVFFSCAVGLIPMASSFYEVGNRRNRATHGLFDMVRLFSLILLIEIASLMGNYY